MSSRFYIRKFIQCEFIEDRGDIGWRWGCKSGIIYIFFEMSQSSLVYINLPVCFVALVILAASLRGVQLKQASDVTWQTLAQKFDFLGL